MQEALPAEEAVVQVVVPELLPPIEQVRWLTWPTQWNSQANETNGAIQLISAAAPPALQIRLVRRSRVVVAVEGGALDLLVFARPGLHVVAVGRDPEAAFPIGCKGGA